MSSETTHTRHTTWLTSRFKLKTLLFTVALALLGALGVYDAAVKYPARGRESASYLQKDYLEVANKHGYMLRSSVDNPQSELAALRTRRPQIMQDARGEGPSAELAEFELAKMHWLESLDRVNWLSAEHTVMDSPHSMRDNLVHKWSSATINAPKALKAYDIPIQWAIAAIGGLGALAILLAAINVARKKFRWEPETKTLILPGGASFTPADLADVDKRKWDKFIVYCIIKKSHPKLGGNEIKLDLYRYEPLESWVLEMEAEAFPDRVEEREVAPEASAQAAPSDGHATGEPTDDVSTHEAHVQG